MFGTTVKYEIVTAEPLHALKRITTTRGLFGNNVKEEYLDVKFATFKYHPPQVVWRSIDEDSFMFLNCWVNDFEVLLTLKGMFLS